MNFKILVSLSLAVACTVANDSFLAERILQTATTQTTSCSNDAGCSSFGGCCATLLKNNAAYNNIKVCTPWELANGTYSLVGASWTFNCGPMPTAPAGTTNTTSPLPSNCTTAAQCQNSTLGTNYCCAQRYYASSRFGVPQTALPMAAGQQCISNTIANPINFTTTAKTTFNNTWAIGTAPNNFTGDLAIMWNCQVDTYGAYVKATLAIFVALFAFALY